MTNVCTVYSCTSVCDNGFPIQVVHSQVFLYRSDGFRSDYGRLGELRALLPPSTRIMALTATATASSRHKIIDSLRMKNPTYISKTPHKKNIFYSVRPKTNIEDLIEMLGSILRNLRTSMPRTIVFCRRYSECALMYTMFQNILGADFTEPSGAPNID